MPVVMVQKELKKSAPAVLEILVDDKCAVENITRCAQTNGYEAAVQNRDGDMLVTLKKK